ncbi:MAG: MmcQ/YjbR family DNA-binding protein [Gemmatimonadaceae bacterium]
MTKRALTPQNIRTLALALPEVEERAHMGRPDFRVRNKIFATLPPDGRSFNVKIAPVNLDALVTASPETYRDVWAGRWVGVQLKGVSAQEATQLLEDAWNLVAPSLLRRSASSAQNRRRP